MKYSLFFLASFFLFACKPKETSPKENKPQKQQNYINDDVFKVQLQVIVREDDKFQLFYVGNSPDDNFNDKERVEVNVKGSQTPQHIEFKLPPEVLPYKFRIDIGEKLHESPVEISLVKVSLNKGILEIDPSSFGRMFQPNIYIQPLDNLNYMRVIVNDKYDPYFLSTPLLDKYIELDL